MLGMEPERQVNRVVVCIPHVTQKHAVRGVCDHSLQERIGFLEQLVMTSSNRARLTCSTRVRTEPSNIQEPDLQFYKATPSAKHLTRL